MVKAFIYEIPLLSARMVYQAVTQSYIKYGAAVWYIESGLTKGIKGKYKKLETA